MTTINFPNSPAVNDTYSFNNRTWVWNGSGWARDVTVTDIINGVITGGTTGQVLTKVNSGDFNTVWETPYRGLPRINTVAYATTVNATATDYDVIRITLTGNVTSFNLTGAVDGQKLIVEFVQDATGNRTVVLGTDFRFGTDFTSISLSTSGMKIDRLGLIYNSAASKYDAIAFIKGF